MSDAPLPSQDDPSIRDDALLWRRIPPWHLVPDQNTGSVRISSAAFEDPKGSSMSVVIAEDVLNSGRNTESVLLGHHDFYLASITAGLARELEQGVVREPLPTEPAHAIVIGKKTKRVSKAFAKNAVWVIGPSQ